LCFSLVVGWKPSVEEKVPHQCHSGRCVHACLSSRATRLGDFSPNRQFFALGRFFLNYRTNPHFCDTCFPKHKLCFNFDENGLGYILGNFFAHSSGHYAFKVYVRYCLSWAWSWEWKQEPTADGSRQDGISQEVARWNLPRIQKERIRQEFNTMEFAKNCSAIVRFC
jgi:hypothetical protein